MKMKDLLKQREEAKTTAIVKVEKPKPIPVEVRRKIDTPQEPLDFMLDGILYVNTYVPPKFRKQKGTPQ